MNENSTAFQAHHDDQKSVLEQLNVINMERMKSNRIVLERRKSSKQINEVHVQMYIHVAGEDEGEVKDAMKPKSLIEKGVPSLLDVITSGSGSGGERSLFS